MPSLLSIVPGYCDAYIPLSESGSLPKPLTSLFNEELMDASYSRAGVDGTAGTVWPYYFLVALRLVGVGYTVGGGSGTLGGAQLM